MFLDSGRGIFNDGSVNGRQVCASCQVDLQFTISDVKGCMECTGLIAADSSVSPCCRPSNCAGTTSR